MFKEKGEGTGGKSHAAVRIDLSGTAACAAEGRNCLSLLLFCILLCLFLA
jgi:hypothetical protein